MPGPAPKHPSKRARRNAPEAGEWVTLPAEPYEGPRPEYEPADHMAGIWEAWWSSPMAHMWEQSDWPFLILLLKLTDEAMNSDDAIRATAEMRQWADKFGLTPEGRQKRRWMLPSASVEEDGTVRERPETGDRRERVLRLVEG